ncbi:MAG: adenine phosphoribosyltransferase [Sphingobacteriales bacterium JAD_PAG50586_3]|nr:MAG: adenine phosphoribosyltransferase [Sphingobacteriales bacterium JAD_PAG50586_3]
MIEERLKDAIRDVADFPKPGIMFKDITPILTDNTLCDDIVEETIKRLQGTKIDAIAGIESRGFLFGFLIAQKLRVPFIPVRKAGKLPYDTIAYTYNLEYGTATIEVHTDAIKAGDNVLIHDDLLATGGTAIAAAELVKQLGGNVAGYSFIVELEFLNGRDSLVQYSDNVVSLVGF